MRPSWFKRWTIGSKWQAKAWDLKCTWDRFGPPKEYRHVGEWNCDERRDAMGELMKASGLILGADFVNVITKVRIWDEEKGYTISQHVFWELYGTNQRDRRGRYRIDGYKIDAAAPNAEIVEILFKGEYI
jgi:hypothetical protein